MEEILNKKAKEKIKNKMNWRTCSPDYPPCAICGKLIEDSPLRANIQEKYEVAFHIACGSDSIQHLFENEDDDVYDGFTCYDCDDFPSCIHAMTMRKDVRSKMGEECKEECPPLDCLDCPLRSSDGCQCLGRKVKKRMNIKSPSIIEKLYEKMENKIISLTKQNAWFVIELDTLEFLGFFAMIKMVMRHPIIKGSNSEKIFDEIHEACKVLSAFELQAEDPLPDDLDAFFRIAIKSKEIYDREIMFQLKLSPIQFVNYFGIIRLAQSHPFYAMHDPIGNATKLLEKGKEKLRKIGFTDDLINLFLSTEYDKDMRDYTLSKY